MGFYDLPKDERRVLAGNIQAELMKGIAYNEDTAAYKYFSDADTYIRKAAYLGIGRIYNLNESLRLKVISLLKRMLLAADFKIRQTVINAAGEIGKDDFAVVARFFDKGLFDGHHSVRNAVIGSVKKMGEKNPVPVLAWASGYLHHADKEIRREICHGIELRGRTHPQDILPMLRQLQFDKTARVRDTLVHVLGQIAYKKGCLATVVTDLEQWENKALVAAAYEEIIDVHHRYRDFAAMTQDAARQYIEAVKRISE